MVTMISLAIYIASAAADAAGLSRVEALETGFVPQTAGIHHVWLWADRSQVQRATIGAMNTFEVPADPKAGGLYSWVKAGEAAFDATPYSITLTAGIAALAISTDASFDAAALHRNTRVVDSPETPRDRRAMKRRSTNTVMTMPHFDSLRTWNDRAAALRQQMLLACGLWPMPERTPLNAVIEPGIAHDDYIIERVRFEAWPGLYVTGNLYRPVGDGPFPAIVCPHGHWQNGRLEDSDTGSVPARCITFARMGIVAFSWDMLGYVDSLQFRHPFGHVDRAIEEPEANALKLWGIHSFALQLWSSIRAVDFVESLSLVDKARIGCTGASGGGTQTFALTAVDPRIKVSAPVNMISCNMQGGCPCENAPLIRLSASNMEIGAMMAPRPMLMVSATGDWTRETPRVEFPAIRSIYDLYGAGDRVETIQIDAGHNYNRASREAVYQFFGKWLLGEADKYQNFTEPTYTLESPDQLRVFPEMKLPEGTKSSVDIIEALRQRQAEKAQTSLPKDPAGRASYLSENEGVLAALTGADIPSSNDIIAERTGYHAMETYLLERWIVGRRGSGDAVPGLLYRSNDAALPRPVVIVDSAGKAAIADRGQGGPGPLVQKLLDRGRAVLVIDVFMTGEHLSPLAETPRTKNNFADTFLPTDAAYRIQDILTAAAFLRSRRDLEDELDIIGLGDAGIWCLMAAAMDRHIGKLAIDANGFANGDDAAWVAKHYIPGIRGAGDLGLVAQFVAPRPLFVHNAGTPFNAAPIESAYAVAAVPGMVHAVASAQGDKLLRIQEQAASIDDMVNAIASP